MLGRGAEKKSNGYFFACTFFTCTSALGGVAASKILPHPGGRGCAKNPADRKFTLSYRFAFHLTVPCAAWAGFSWLPVGRLRRGLLSTCRSILATVYAGRGYFVAGHEGREVAITEAL